jgi:peroxiredoxin family protein
MNDPITKVSIIISNGSLDGIYPALIMANGARAEGMEANLLFTFFGLDAVHKARHEHIKLSTVGNPGLHMPTMLGGIPGVSTAVTQYMNHKMEQLDIPSIPEFVEMIADIITVGEFYTKAAGARSSSPDLSNRRSNVPFAHNSTDRAPAGDPSCQFGQFGAVAGSGANSQNAA